MNRLSNLQAQAIIGAALALTRAMPAGATPILGTNTTSGDILDHSTIERPTHVSESGLLNSLSVTLVADHTWIGDLIIRLMNSEPMWTPT